jgi:hypothetical protein
VPAVYVSLRAGEDDALGLRSDGAGMGQGGRDGHRADVMREFLGKQRGAGSRPLGCAC